MHLLLFDVDGTLVRGGGLGRRAMEAAFRDVFGVDVSARPEARRVRFAGSSDRRIFAEMAAALGLSEAQRNTRWDELTAEYLRRLETLVAESPEHEPCPGVDSLLQRLHAEPRIHLALLTGNFERGARIKIARFGWNRYFPFGAFAEDGESRADMARRALALAEAKSGHRFSPDHVMVVGDTRYDVEAGRAHGFVTVGVGTGPVPRETVLEAGPDAFFEDLTPEHGFEEWVRDLWRLGPSGERAEA